MLKDDLDSVPQGPDPIALVLVIVLVMQVLVVHYSVLVYSAELGSVILMW